MNLSHPRRHLLGAIFIAAVAGVAPLAHAQTPAAVMPRLEGRASDGRNIRLSDLRGRVVLVLYWSTGCAVCRDKMQELRANLAGWQGRPFSVLGVNVDPRPQDLLDYERLVASTVPPHLRFPSLHVDSPGFLDSMARPTRLPGAYLVDTQGRLVERYEGRIPPEAWDRIAELL